MGIQHGSQDPRVELRVCGFRGEKIAADQHVLGCFLLFILILYGFRIEIPAMNDINRRQAPTSQIKTDFFQHLGYRDAMGIQGEFFLRRQNGNCGSGGDRGRALLEIKRTG